jgi:steroid delta-isomerase-like uncharacterized protein
VTVEENKTLIRRFYEEIWNRGDIAVADEVIATHIIDHDRDPETRIRSPESAKQLVTSIRTIFPDLHFAIEDEIAQSNKVAVRWTVRGTHKAEFMGIPATDKQVTWEGMHFWRVADGKIVEVWDNRDDLGLMQQLGAIPPLG